MGSMKAEHERNEKSVLKFLIHKYFDYAKEVIDNIDMEEVGRMEEFKKRI